MYRPLNRQTRIILHNRKSFANQIQTRYLRKVRIGRIEEDECGMIAGEAILPIA